MSERSLHSTAGKTRSASVFTAWTVLSFVVLSGLLTWLCRNRGPEDIQWQIRAGILRDLISEFSIGRQALVSSLWIMPLPTILALPFTPFVGPEAYGLAYLYGLALALSMATIPLASLLRKAGIPLGRLVSVTLLAACAYAVGATRYSDMLVCASCLVIAVFFDTHKEAVLRALAGVFYGLALLAHPVGLVVAVGKAGGIVVDWFFAGSDKERRSVHWIQGMGMAYVFFTYLFLNWMIMRAPLWPFEHFTLHEPAVIGRQATQELATALARRYPSSAPVVSGHWGYMVEPILRDAGGHHFIDFHRDKVPSWERRELVLVVPTEANPLVGLSDIAAVLHRDPAALSGYLLLSESPFWEFYLIVKPEQ